MFLGGKTPEVRNSKENQYVQLLMLLGSNKIEDCLYNAEKIYNKSKEFKDNNMNQTQQTGKGSWHKNHGIHFVNISLLLVKCYLMLDIEANESEILLKLLDCRRVLENGIDVDINVIK